jgi:hypothetical protein
MVPKRLLALIVVGQHLPKEREGAASLALQMVQLPARVSLLLKQVENHKVSQMVLNLVSNKQILLMW